MHRVARLAVAVWVPIGAFAMINRGFERRVLEPMVGNDLAEGLASATLAGVVFAIALLWLGGRCRERGPAETGVVSAVWAAAAALLSAAASATSWFGGWREALVLVAASAAAPWFARALQARRHGLSSAG